MTEHMVRYKCSIVQSVKDKMFGVYPSELIMRVFTWTTNKYLYQIFGQEINHLNVQKLFNALFKEGQQRAHLQ